jgi:hypothetical protein
MTLGNAANAKVRLIVLCKTCGNEVEPDAAEMAARYGPDTPVLDWRDRLVCSGFRVRWPGKWIWSSPQSSGDSVSSRLRE